MNDGIARTLGEVKMRSVGKHVLSPAWLLLVGGRWWQERLADGRTVMETLSRWLQELAEVRCARVCRLAGCLAVVMQRRLQAEAGVGHLGDGTAQEGAAQQRGQGPSKPSARSTV